MQTLVRNLLIFGSIFSFLGVVTYTDGIGDLDSGRGRTRLFKLILSGLADLLGSEEAVGILMFSFGILLFVWAAIVWFRGVSDS